jgi:hypothetical protein
MAYAQWIQIKIVSENMTVAIKDVDKGYGKFYQEGDKDKEISVDDIKKIKVGPGKSASIYACGRKSAASGTNGSITFCEDPNPELESIGEFEWSCPWAKKANTFSWTQVESTESDYFTSIDGGNKDAGAIGTVTIVFIKK